MTEQFVEIVECFDRTKPLYEVMTSANWKKKSEGEQYDVLFCSEAIPYVNFGDPIKMATIKKEMSFMEFQNRFNP